ncbi:hypothetical protein GCM10023175_72450 [Pseudonocardia xishanensis]|uniref:Uncharacterized protein n=1 Tax=Pseudonocardia xishanensis TaxID=630995 RepID=A0ABP8S3X8_9PSEU
MDLRAAFASISFPTKRLLAMADRWAKESTPSTSTHVAQPRYQRKQQPSLAERLGEADVQTLIHRYRAGTTAPKLAEYSGRGLSTVKRLLRARGVRLSP